MGAMRYVGTLVTGCQTQIPKPAATGPAVKKDGHDHEESHVHGKGPHGGVVFDVGKFHGELTVDHDKKEVTLYVLGKDEKTPTPVEAKDLTVATKPAKTKEGKEVPPMTIKLQGQEVKDGKASKYVGTDPGLANEADYEGTVTGVLDGKPSQGEFKEEPEAKK
jgi:hypothetical protein